MTVYILDICTRHFATLFTWWT